MSMYIVVAINYENMVESQWLKCVQYLCVMRGREKILLASRNASEKVDENFRKIEIHLSETMNKFTGDVSNVVKVNQAS